MSTSIFYHGFGICFYRYTRTEYQQDPPIFSIKKEPTSLRCGTVCQVTLGFADVRHTSISAFQCYAIEISRYITIIDVS